MRASRAAGVVAAWTAHLSQGLRRSASKRVKSRRVLSSRSWPRCWRPPSTPRSPAPTATRTGPARCGSNTCKGRLEPATALIDSPQAVRIGLLDTRIGNHDRVGNMTATTHGSGAGESVSALVGFDHGAAWLPHAMDYPAPI